MARIFISHSSKDRDHAQRMQAWLDEHRHVASVFLDVDEEKGIVPGEGWERRLYREIEAADGIILIMTPDWMASKWCFAEYAQANALGKRIYCTIFSPVGGPWVAPEIQHVDLVDWNQGGARRLETALAQLAESVEGGFAVAADRSPYPGLSAFEMEDAGVFFGRLEQTREVEDRLRALSQRRDRRMIAIAGASGSGKSSLLKAGLLPRLDRDRNAWIVLPHVRPERLPLTALAKSIAHALRDSGAAWQDIHRRLLAEPERMLDDLVDRLRVDAARLATLLLPIDQLEELFTLAPLAEPDNEVDAFLDVIGHMMDEKRPFAILATLRSDFLAAMQGQDRLDRHCNLVSLAPVAAPQLRRIIEGPARRRGVTVEPALLDVIAADARGADALPLLAYTLRVLWELPERDPARLTLRDYTALGDPAEGLSGLQVSIRSHAEGALDALRATQEELVALKRAFIPFLVRVNDDGSFVRQPARADMLPPGSRRLIDALIAARLLRTWERDGEPMIEVAHEALFTAWPKLSAWLEEEREFLSLKARVAALHRVWRAATRRKRRTALLNLHDTLLTARHMEENPDAFRVEADMIRRSKEYWDRQTNLESYIRSSRGHFDNMAAVQAEIDRLTAQIRQIQRRAAIPGGMCLFYSVTAVAMGLFALSMLWPDFGRTIFTRNCYAAAGYDIPRCAVTIVLLVGTAALCPSSASLAAVLWRSFRDLWQQRNEFVALRDARRESHAQLLVTLQEQFPK